MTVNDLITTANSGTITLNGAANTFVAAVDFLNTATVLGNGAGDVSTFNGGVASTGNGTYNVQGTVRSSADALHFGTGVMTLAGDTSIDATNAGGSAGGGNINFGSLTGAFDLAVNAGTGGAIAVNTTTNITDLTLTRATGTTFTGNVTVNDLITTANSGTITLNGAANTFVAAVDFLNTGLVTLGNGGDSSTFANGVTFSANAASNLGGAIVTSGDVANFGTGGVTLGSDSTVDTTNAGGSAAGANIIFGAGIAGAFDLGLTAGTGGAVTVATTTNITDLTLTSATSNTFTGNVTVNDLITTANSGTITLNGAANTFVAAVDFLNTATVLGNGAADFRPSTGGVASTGNGTYNVQGTVRSSADALHFGTGVMTLAGDTSIDATNAGGSAGGGNINFGSLTGAFDLAVNAGTGGAIAVNTTTNITDLTLTRATSNYVHRQCDG